MYSQILLLCLLFIFKIDFIYTVQKYSSKIRLATSRPLGERSEPFLAAKRPTASDEVARGRLVSLAGFSFAFRAKNGEWRDSHLGLKGVDRPNTTHKLVIV